MGATWCCGITLPAYWSPPTTGTGPYDSEGILTTPYQVLPGGYTQIWDGSKWNVPAEHRSNLPTHKGVMARGARRNARVSP